MTDSVLAWLIIGWMALLALALSAGGRGSGGVDGPMGRGGVE